MSENWKPGDVAMVTVSKASAPGYPNDAEGAVDLMATRYGTGWSALVDVDYYWPDRGVEVVAARRLVVIDPEDREQVERLVTAYEATMLGDFTAEMQAALREFANPTNPKPEEPTGLGAVVEDEAGRRFVRYEQGAGWNWLDGTASRQWNDIAAVRVLSEGVTP